MGLKKKKFDGASPPPSPGQWRLQRGTQPSTRGDEETDPQEQFRPPGVRTLSTTRQYQGQRPAVSLETTGIALRKSLVWAEGSSHCCHVITEAPLLPPRVSKKTQLENLGFQPQPTRDLNKIQSLIKYSKIKWKITRHQEPGKSQLE